MKITLPPAGVGLREVRADGLEVGSADRLWGHQPSGGNRETPMTPAWHADLWASARESGSCRNSWCTPRVKAKVIRTRLDELRAELQRKLDEEGPWWA